MAGNCAFWVERGDMLAVALNVRTEPPDMSSGESDEAKPCNWDRSSKTRLSARGQELVIATNVVTTFRARSFAPAPRKGPQCKARRAVSRRVSLWALHGDRLVLQKGGQGAPPKPDWAADLQGPPIGDRLVDRQSPLSVP